MTECERLGVHCTNEPSEEALDNFWKIAARIAMRYAKEELQREREMKQEA
ncbi:hypothetical protein [Alicyclobacillus sp. SO9]|nr:hypothetical protein [Alicyclobacillus sp. SO9]QQE81542.1 hypothetical protein GI364_24900 [Alicyclobacillus sp. SO9]